MGDPGWVTALILRPVTEADLPMLRRFAVEPGLIGNDWAGFRDPRAQDRRLARPGPRLAGPGPALRLPVPALLYSRLRTDPPVAA
jgi:hypothetical protein